MGAPEDEDESPPKKKAQPPVSPSAAPPRVGARIADVEPFHAPFEPPPGALRAPVAPPVWTARGEDTGQLAMPEPSSSVPKTVELELPEVRVPPPPPPPRAAPIPATREAHAPPPKPRSLFTETTYVLSEAQLRGEAPVPMRAPAKEEDPERITYPDGIPADVGEEDTMGDTTSPYFDASALRSPDDPLRIYEETTAVLHVPKDDGADSDEEDLDGYTHVDGRGHAIGPIDDD
jgi:hypothetical protein